MSKIALSPNASGTGVVTLSTPNTNSDRTLALPDSSGTIATLETIPDQGVPTGMLSYFASSTAPIGFLAADGSTISRTTYAALFAITGEIYGAGDGSSTFELPDLRGEFMRGVDSGRGVDTPLGNTRVFGSSQAGQFGAHDHIGGGLNHVSHTRLYGGSPTSGSSATGGDSTSRYNMNTSTVGGTENSNETRPRNVALLACIKH